MNKYELTLAILRGDFDNDLRSLNTVICQRIKEMRRVKASEVMMTLNKGDKVRFVATTRPAYLAGRTATVVGFKSSKVSVEMDHGVGRFMSGLISAPASILEKV